MKYFSAILAATLLLTSFAYAQQARYVRDELYVPIRSGQGSEYRILQMGVSGTKLTVLEDNKQTGYSKVRTEGGEEGWIESQYLQDSPVAATLLARANRELEQLRTQNAELKRTLGETRGAEQGASEALQAASSERDRLRDELDKLRALSANAIDLDKDNRELRHTNQELRNRADVLSAENQQLRDSRENDAFLNGAFAVVIGVGITLLVPRLWPKRKSEWG
ncbi:MAG TPA: TIGR04211 family SH3 domain-containing protein [Spongiibacteraceae bacterium]|nr:TIGR04211 family SH3 domain-containing protein [Spongiibacteraceae bacterium]HUH38700.1 TIGR04211 family SH3 domain-containing protein [Spongiibacteraceae bacterium]